MVAPITPKQARRPGALSDELVKQINKQLDGSWKVSEFRGGRQVRLPQSVTEDDRASIIQAYEDQGWSVTAKLEEGDGPTRPGCIVFTFDIKRD